MHTYRSFARHLVSARSNYRVHSPFVFDFYQQVLRGTKPAISGRIAQLRRSLLSDRTVLTFEDLGAGSRSGTPSTIGQLARRAARKERVGSLLYRLCGHYDRQTLLELGTHMGFSALYQAAAVPDSAFYSIEGIPALAALARQHLSQFGLSGHVLEGTFEAWLDKEPLRSLQPDYVLIDGDHRYESTIHYANTLLNRMPQESIIVLDDIYWSQGMTKAWREIVSWPEVSISIDLFWIGICFVKRAQAKEHFVFRL